MRQHKTPQCH